MDFKNFKEVELQKPEVANEYKKLQQEITVIQAMTGARENQDLYQYDLAKLTYFQPKK